MKRKTNFATIQKLLTHLFALVVSITCSHASFTQTAILTDNKVKPLDSSRTVLPLPNLEFKGVIKATYEGSKQDLLKL